MFVLQGLIIAVLDILGNKVVEYRYDAWGNHTVTGSNTALGNLNPFRYRGYYYDTETGLYYLQTRYYDPEVGRFLNMDSIDYADPESLDGLNLYAYCNNNPVMYSDPTGHFAFSVLVGIILGAIVGGAVGGVVAYNQASKNGATGRELAGWTALGVIGGGLVGGAVGAGIGAVASYFGSFLSSSYSLGSIPLASGEAITISLTRAQTAAVGLGLGILLLAKGSGPRFGHNQYEKQMWEEAKRQTGLSNNKDLARRVHNQLHRYQYCETLKDLIKTIHEILLKLGY